MKAYIDYINRFTGALKSQVVVNLSIAGHGGGKRGRSSDHQDERTAPDVINWEQTFYEILGVAPNDPWRVVKS
eukprot:981669-Karenia_brevis.AAC.1